MTSLILGIVGSEAIKFTAETEAKARKAIRGAYKSLKATKGCSGGCHLGGIDIWAKEEGILLLGAENFIEFPPAVFRWRGTKSEPGFMERNISIAETSDIVICFTLKVLPESYTGMRFTHCYHCGTDDHVKSGGCWTTKHARSLGKPGYTLVIE